MHVLFGNAVCTSSWWAQLPRSCHSLVPMKCSCLQIICNSAVFSLRFWQREGRCVTEQRGYSTLHVKKQGKESGLLSVLERQCAKEFCSFNWVQMHSALAVGDLQSCSSDSATDEDGRGFLSRALSMTSHGDLQHKLVKMKCEVFSLSSLGGMLFHQM